MNQYMVFWYIENLWIWFDTMFQFLGLSSLTKMYNLLANNALWLTEQLDIPSLFTHNEGGSTYRHQTEFKLDISNPAAKDFNPLHEFCHIGNSIFDHVSN